MILPYKLLSGIFAAFFVGLPLALQGIDPIGDIIRAGGGAGLEVTVIVLGFFITIMVFRMLSTATKSGEKRIDALIEANEAFMGNALKTMETVGRMRQEAMEHVASDIRGDIKAAEQKIDEVLRVVSNKGKYE